MLASLQLCSTAEYDVGQVLKIDRIIPLDRASLNEVISQAYTVDYVPSSG